MSDTETQRLLGALDERTAGLVDDVRELVVTVRTLVDMGERRDGTIAGIKQRQSDDAHKAAEDNQKVSSQVVQLTRSVEANAREASAAMVGLRNDLQNHSDRIERLEVPVRRALAQRVKRRQTLTRIVTVSATVTGFLWMLFDPIYHFFAETLMKRWLGP